MPRSTRKSGREQLRKTMRETLAPQGIDALIPPQSAATELPLDLLDPGPYQFREDGEAEEQALEELAASIKQHGILQAIQVRPAKDGRYEIVFGHRRAEAARRAGLKVIPARIKPMDDTEAFGLSFTENEDREDISALARARMLKAWLQQTRRRQIDLAEAIGRSKAYVSQHLHILRLPESVQELFGRANSPLTEGHTRHLIRLHVAEDQEKLAEKVVTDQLSIVETRAEVDKKLGLFQPEPAPPPGPSPPERTPLSPRAIPLMVALREATRVARELRPRDYTDRDLVAAVRALEEAARRIQVRLEVLAKAHNEG